MRLFTQPLALFAEAEALSRLRGIPTFRCSTPLSLLWGSGLATRQLHCKHRRRPLTYSQNHNVAFLQSRAYNTLPPLDPNSGMSSSSLDTSRYIQMLEKEGFTRQQSEALLQLLAEAIEESMQTVTKGGITKEEQRRIIETYKSEFKGLRRDISVLSRKDFANLKAELERITLEGNKLRDAYRADVQRVQAGVRLDINLEKGRVKDEVGLLEEKVKHADSRIDVAVEVLKERMDVIQQEMTTAITRIMMLIFGIFAVYKFTTMPKRNDKIAIGDSK